MERHPFDFEQIQKGDIISTDEIEKAYGVSRFEKAFAFSLLRGTQAIESQRHDLVARVSQESIHILTDREADAYLAGQRESAIRRLKRAAARTARVDRSDYSDAERKHSEAESRMSVMVAMMAEKGRRDSRKALIEARDALALEAGEPQKKKEMHARAS